MGTDRLSAIGIAGAGRVAQALGWLLAERGQPVRAVASRNPQHAAAAAAFIGPAAPVLLEDLPDYAARILVAVSDDAVEDVARRLAAAGMSGGVALHTCGARGPEALAELASAGVSCGVLHPLQTVASPGQGVGSLPGSTFAISGDPAATAWAREIVALLDGTLLHIAPDRMPLYHAAAVMASNYMTALVHAAVILMETAGIDEKTALGALAPLVRASVENALTLGPETALTGPIQRGDSESIRRHLGSFAGVPPSASDLYRSAGLHVLEMARRRGLAEPEAREIEMLLRKEDRDA